MNLVLPNFSNSIFCFALPKPSSRRRIRCSTVPMTSGNDLTTNFMEFPYVSGPHKKLMVEMVSAMEDRFGSALLPCTLPSDVQQFGNASGTSRGSLHIRSALPSSQIDFMLASWIHCEFPSGGALNITSLSAYLKPTTDAPNFVLELIRSSPTTLLLVLDLTPRKDLIMYPNYLKTYYEDTQLDRHRQLIQKLPEAKPYMSPVLYIRSAFSPTAITVFIDVGDSETRTIDDIIQDHIHPAAKELLQFWMESCACLEKDVGEAERAYLAERDLVMKNQTIEADLASNFPRMFGQDVADKTLGVLKEFYNKVS